MLADILTKDMAESQKFRDVFIWGVYQIEMEKVNEVRAVFHDHGAEIRMKA